jgi:hypothetical protein
MQEAVEWFSGEEQERYKFDERSAGHALLLGRVT